MPLDFVLRGPGGTPLKVTSEGTLGVVIHNHPPAGDSEQPRPIRQLLATAAGATDMLVDGSSTNVVFSINAAQEFDLYIKVLSFVIADAGASLNKFGNIAALTNGCALEWESGTLGTVAIHDALKSNFDFARLALGNPSFGDGTGAFRASNVISTSEAYMPVVDLQAVFGWPFGIRLRKGSLDRLKFTIKDDVQAIDQFDCIAYGIKL